MVKQKGTGGGALAQGSGELSHVEFELQIHKDHTTAKFDELQTTLNVYQEALNSFRTEMLEELRSMKVTSAAVEDRPDASLLKFGSLPPSPILAAQPDSASSTRAMTSTGPSPGGNAFQSSNFQLDMLDKDASVVPTVSGDVVASGVNLNPSCALISNAPGAIMSTIPSADKRGQATSSSGKMPVSEHQPSTHYFQHSIMGTQPLPTSGPYHAFSSQHHNVSQLHHHNDPFTMSYSGPYSHTGISGLHTFPQPSYSYAGTNFASTPMVSQISPHTLPPSYTANPFFATTTSPFPMFTQLPGPSHAHTMLPNQFMPHPYIPQPQLPGNFDPNLPTMTQMKLEFSVFHGGDPVEWLNKAEKYFEFYQIPEERKLAIATMHLTEKASDRWFMFKHEFPQSWLGLADLLMREFSSHNVGDYQATLARMSQTSTVEQYMDQFTRLSRRAPGFSPQVLLSCFIGGLKDSIKADVKAQKPRSLYEACELAKIYEQRELSLKQQSRLNYPNRIAQHRPNNAPFRAPQVVQVPQTRPPAAPPLAGGANLGGNRRLTQAEYQERRARNQCFFCDEIFRPGHNCRRGQLMIIEVVQEEIEVEAAEPPLPELVEDRDGVQLQVVEAANQEIELQAMGDGSKTSTMQLKGILNQRKVHVLIDSGASHNFIHPAALTRSKHLVKPIKPLKVRLASGDVMQTKGQVRVELCLQKFTFVADFYVLPVSGCELVLGAIWLRSLGDILWNFDTMKMKFHSTGHEYTLQGETEPNSAMVSCKVMNKLLKKEREAVIVQLSSMVPPRHTANMHPEIQKLIQKYAPVFDEPRALPPARPQDHHIELLPNTAPMSVRPYRCIHTSKKLK
ncbi:hypothetical protein ABKV19_026048 [Rosa sericea]